MAGIERTDQPNRQGRPSDREPAREENRKGGDLAGRFGTGGTPFGDGSGKGRDHLHAREKVFAQALRASEARGTPETKTAGPDGEPGAPDRRVAAADADRRNGRSGRGNAEEEAGAAVLLARAGPGQGAAGGLPVEAVRTLPADLAHRIETLARKVGDQIDAQLRVNLIGAGDGGFRLRVAIDDPGMALKSITVRGEGDVLSVNLHFAEDMVDRETLATLAGQLASTLAARFPRRTIEISGLPVVGADAEDDRETVVADTTLSALFARR